MLAREPAELGHIDEVVFIYINILRPLNIGPLGQVLALSAENLDPVVLAVGDEHATVPMGPKTVRCTELAWAGTGLAPGLQERPLRVETVDTGVAVAVRHIQVAPGPDRQVRRFVIWRPAVGDG